MSATEHEEIKEPRRKSMKCIRKVMKDEDHLEEFQKNRN